MTTANTEVVGLDQCIAYTEHLAGEAGAHGPDGNEAYLTRLAGYRVTGDGLTTGRDMQAAFAAAAAAATRHAGELGKQKNVQEAYDANPDAGDKDFQTGADGGSPATTTDRKGAPVNDTVSDQPTTEPQPAGQTRPGSRCSNCGYVTMLPTEPGPNGQVAVEPVGCRYCRQPGVTFDPTDVFYPDRPSDEAIDRDTRDVETAIRAAYHRLAEESGYSVPLADIRDALPAEYDRETVDAALYKLAGHSDFYVTPRNVQKQAPARDQQAALNMGNQQNHEVRIYPENRMIDVVQRVRSVSRVQAESTLAPLTDDQVVYIAEKMGVDTSGDPAQLRSRIAAQSEANRQAWLADATQGRLDGTLLYRADNEPEWVATWTDEDRAAAAAAAARLQHRAATEESWAFVKDRADRWAERTSA